MICLVGPVWRLFQSHPNDLGFLFMPRGTTRDTDCRIVQMIDLHRVVRVTFDGGEWRLGGISMLYTAPQGSRFAGHVAVRFCIDQVVSHGRKSFPWDGPVGVMLYTDRIMYELIPCSRVEYERIPTKHARAVA